jgi:hypothetical protein
MKLQQLSVFLENRPSQILDPCRLLGRHGISIRTLAVADMQKFGILRMVVSDTARAAGLLREAGFVTDVTEVVAIEVPDRPGGLAEVIAAFENSPVNIEYMYAFTFGRGDTAVLIFRFDDPDAAIALLRGTGINLAGNIEGCGPVA